MLMLHAILMVVGLLYSESNKAATGVKIDVTWVKNIMRALICNFVKVYSGYFGNIFEDHDSGCCSCCF